MTQEELQEIIRKLEASASPENATFGVFIYGDSTEGCIKANSKGLKLFAVELLIAANSFQNNKNSTYHQLELPDWVNDSSDIIIDYIEPIPNLIEVETYETTWQDKLSLFGCLFVVGILIISMLIGLGTIFSWLLF